MKRNMIEIKLSKVKTFRLRKVCGFWKGEKREGKTQTGVFHFVDLRTTMYRNEEGQKK